MNNPKTLAKITVSALGIFLLVRMLPQFFSAFLMIFLLFEGSIQILQFLAHIALTLLWGFLIYLLLIRRRDAIAEWIVKGTGHEEIKTQAGWITLGFKLICFAAGLLFCFNFFYRIPSIITYTLFYFGHGQGVSMLQNSFGILLLLPAGIYLLYGAPALVRWQVAKTLEICNEYSSSGKETSGSEI